MIVNFIFTSVILGQLFGGISANCAWYGECNIDEKSRIQNCPYSGPAKPLEDPVAIKTLQDYCPHYISSNYDTDSGKVSTCCDANQLKTFVSKMAIAVAFLDRCPSCYRNFASLFCAIMCDPEQSSFVKILKTAINSKGVSYVDSVQIYMEEKTLNGTFNACKQVMMPTTGQLVLDMWCGPWGSEKCTPQRWFSFMGTKSDYVPVSIEYVTKNDDNSSFKLFNLTTYSCYEAVDDTGACSCVDCKESCPLYIEPENKTEDVFLLEYYLFALMLVTLLFVIFVYKIFPIRVLFYLKNQDSSNKMNLSTISYNGEQKEKDISCRCRIPCKAKLEVHLQEFFTCLGEICATHPRKILIFSIIMISCTTYGINSIDLTIDPVELWTTNGSRCREERQYFNENFGPFYRIEQVIVTAKNLDHFVRNSSDGEQKFGPAFHKPFLLAFKALQDDILKLGGSENGLQNICFAPLANPGDKLWNTKKCLILSVWGYFKNNKILFDRVEKNSDGLITSDYLDKIRTCTQNSFNPNCLAEYGGPVEPAAVLGGFLAPGESLNKSDSFMKATSLSLNILVQNHLNKSENEAALKWEKLFVDFMKNYTKHKPDNMDVSFFSERSIEDEINRESEANVTVVVISYLAMFLYISLTLGRFQFVYQFLLESRIVVGFAGVLLVFSSVVASVGLNSMFGISITLIALEVVPFLVLAVGVDNIFILVHAFEKEPLRKNEPFEKYVGRILGRVGPSILLTGASESGCFFLGAVSPMPCIKSFALFAAVALLTNFILQLTCFVSIITLDCRRRMDRRMDIFCCFKVNVDQVESKSILKCIFENVFTPFVLSKVMRPLIIIAFFAWNVVSLVVLPRISLGLEQDLALPRDSYIKDYFKDLHKNIAIGPPVYFVITDGLNLTDPSMQNLLCNGQYCDQFSITNQIYAASKNTSKTKIAKPSSSWIDDYFAWLQSPGCCVVDAKTNGTCICGQGCKACDIVLQSNHRPKPEDFNRHLSKFLSMNPSIGCVKGGRAAYGQGVKYRSQNGSLDIGPYHFMTYHSILRTSEDFYTALKQARSIADVMTETLRSKTKTNVKVMAYSIFYIFYEQYLTIWQESIKSISLSLLTIFVIVFVLTFGNLTTSVIILSAVTMIVVNMLALLYFLGIQLNALSLVNIVMSIGIAVEFCCHVVVRFCQFSEGTRLTRVQLALNSVGPSIFSGITATKFIGISVLFFARSEVFKVYFFQMYLGIVLIGALHGLVFVPVVLSYFGPITKNCNISSENLSLKYEVIDAKELEDLKPNSLIQNNEEN